MRFNVLSQGNKLFGSNGTFYVVNLDKSLPPMSMGGSGDPHMLLRVAGGPILATWDDNAVGSAGTELLFFYLETSTDTISVFYTNADWGGPKVIGSARYIHNGTSYNLSSAGTTTVGPVTIECEIYTAASTNIMALTISFDKINNVLKFGGAFAIALAASQAAGGYVDGGWGASVDGYANLASMIQARGVVNPPTRNDMVVGQGVTVTNGVVSASSSVIFDTSNDNIQQVLGFANANAIGARAEAAGLPLDPGVIVAGKIAAPGGDFDGLINPASNTNGIINPAGGTGAGLQIYGADALPSSLAGAGTHYVDDYGGPLPPLPQSLPGTKVISWD